MGVIYKLKPEIRDFILKQKTKNPNLSCRKLAALISEKFLVKVSKSRINSIIKQAGLSSRVGRRAKPKRRSMRETEGLGAFMLKAADSLLGGVNYFVQEIEKQLSKKGSDRLNLTETLLYLPLFGQEPGIDSGLWQLVNKRYTGQELSSYLLELQEVTSLHTNLPSLINQIFRPILFLRITFSDGSVCYLDGQFHTLWSSPRIPFDFSITDYKIKSYINKYFLQGKPIVLFTAPGYDVFPKEWLDFLIKLNSEIITIDKITLIGSKFQELETITELKPKDYFVVFALWPWQHLKYRKVEFLGEFKPFSWGPEKKNFYLAETIIQLSQPNTNQSLIINGAVLKESLAAKLEMIILGNLPKAQASPEYIANIYLNCWPNLQEGLKEFSRKIELFTYSASSREVFDIEKVLSQKETRLGIQESLAKYLEGLDAYVRWYFLPKTYREMDFSTIKKRFYCLKARLKKEKDSYWLKFILPENYPHQKDLKYAIARMNESEIILSDGKRLWFVTP